MDQRPKCLCIPMYPQPQCHTKRHATKMFGIKLNIKKKQEHKLHSCTSRCVGSGDLQYMWLCNVCRGGDACGLARPLPLIFATSGYGIKYFLGDVI